MRKTKQSPQDEDQAGNGTVQQLVGALKKLSGEIKWRNHRAAPEVKDAVLLVAGELERTAETVLCSTSALVTPRTPQRGATECHLALLEAKDKMALLEGLVRRALSGAAASPTFIGDTARIQIALAKLDEADVFAERRRLLGEELRHEQEMTDALLHQLRERLAEMTAAAAERSAWTAAAMTTPR